MNKKQILYLGLGSNIENRSDNLNKALLLIQNTIGNLIAISSIYLSSPWGKLNQNDFFNQVVEIETDLELMQIFERTQNIEQKMGRIKREKWGERLIDIDILFFGQNIIKTDKIIVPHQYIEKRNFVLVPMAEIAPNFKHPISQKTIKELKSICNDKSEVEIYRIMNISKILNK